MGHFDDILAGNAAYRPGHHDLGRTGRARLGLAVVTCIDSRLDPLRILGIEPGDAKILRTAGARVTDDVIRSLAIACAVLDVDRIALVQHTDCAMAQTSEIDLAEKIAEASGGDTGDLHLLTMDDQRATLLEDLGTIRRSPLIAPSVTAQGFVFDLRTGALEPVIV